MTQPTQNGRGTIDLAGNRALQTNKKYKRKTNGTPVTQYSVVLIVVTGSLNYSRRTARVKIKGRDTLYPWTGLPIESVLVGTHVCFVCVEIKKEQLYSFRARGD